MRRARPSLQSEPCEDCGPRAAQRSGCKPGRGAKRRGLPRPSRAGERGLAAASTASCRARSSRCGAKAALAAEGKPHRGAQRDSPGGRVARSGKAACGRAANTRFRVVAEGKMRQMPHRAEPCTAVRRAPRRGALPHRAFCDVGYKCASCLSHDFSTGTARATIETSTHSHRRCCRKGYNHRKRKAAMLEEVLYAAQDSQRDRRRARAAES